MRVAVAVDHGGFSLKQVILDEISKTGSQPIDLGAYTDIPADDYPDYAQMLGHAIRAGEAERGVLVCGSGVGACIAVNKIPGIYAAIAHDVYSAAQGVQHDNMNVLCLGARVIGDDVARTLVAAFLGATFSTEERHRRRVGKTRQIEAAALV
ncbi:MAG TPA: RpiB/LacA/LacB family sugar-phosphate isomerase, partial [Anaerolineaceae bacterium]